MYINVSIGTQLFFSYRAVVILALHYHSYCRITAANWTVKSLTL